VTTVRSAKVKGSALEYDTWYSLSQRYQNVKLTKQLGFQMQYDIEMIDIAIECKRLKGISWNQLVKFHEKLCRVSKKSGNYLVFQSNRQPALVFYGDGKTYAIEPFEQIFGVPFVKHPSTRAERKRDDTTTTTTTTV